MSNSTISSNNVVAADIFNKILFKTKPPRNFEDLLPLVCSSRIMFGHLQWLMSSTKSVHLEGDCRDTVFIYLGDFNFEYDVAKLGTSLIRPAIMYGERISGKITPWVKEMLAERRDPVCIGVMDMSNEDLADVLIYPCVKTLKFESYNPGLNELIQTQSHVTEVILNLHELKFDLPAVEKISLNVLSMYIEHEDIMERLNPKTRKFVLRISNELNSYNLGLRKFIQFFTLDLEELVFDTLFENYYDPKKSAWLIDGAAASFFDDVEEIKKTTKVKNLRIRLRYQWLFRDTRDLTTALVDTLSTSLASKRFRLTTFVEERMCIFEATVGDGIRCTMTFC
uniref:IPPc domain-containing protein n=1 Tax=Panagrellus redivivus TaxID=6233 RepID=A0A7E4ZWK7_PANRE